MIILIRCDSSRIIIDKRKMRRYDGTGDTTTLKSCDLFVGGLCRNVTVLYYM